MSYCCVQHNANVSNITDLVVVYIIGVSIAEYRDAIKMQTTNYPVISVAQLYVFNIVN